MRSSEWAPASVADSTQGAVGEEPSSYAGGSNPEGSIPSTGKPHSAETREVGGRAVRGLAWMVAANVAMKIVSVLGQIVLAWLLLEEDFGLFAMAMAVSGLATLFHTAGVREVLIHRQASFHRWATPALWLSLLMGLVAMVLILSISPFVARIYGEPELESLLAVFSLAIPVRMLDTVPRAFLQSQLRFGTLASVRLISHVAELATAVGLAWAGFGAMSFVLPKPFVDAAQTLVLWVVSRPPLSSGIGVRKWRYLLNHSGLSLIAAALLLVISQGDYLLLGVLFSAEVVGIYFFAYRLSVQSLSLFNSSLAQVLLPTLSRFTREPERQVRGFLNGLRLLALGIVPVCLLQAALADPVVRIMFAERWYPAIPVLQILSVAMAFHAVGGDTGVTLLRAQGRFGLLAGVLFFRALIFLVLMGVGAVMGGIVGAAFGVLAFMATVGALGFTAAVRPGGGDWTSYWRIILPPFAIGIVAVGGAVAVARFLVTDSPLVESAVILILASGLYALGARVFLREIWDVLVVRLRQAMPSRLRVAAGVNTEVG